MNNEPVAWIAKTYYPNGLFEDDLVWSKVDENSIPLYTHPVKEEHFEDEPQAEELHEIMQSNTHPVEEQDESFDRTASHMAGEYVSHSVKEQDTDCQYCKQGCIRCDARKQLTDEEIMQIVEESYMPQGMDKSRYTGFARAILRKAQEKC